MTEFIVRDRPPVYKEFFQGSKDPSKHIGEKKYNIHSGGRDVGQWKRVCPACMRS